MSELLTITIVSIILAALSHYFSEYDPIQCKYGRRDWFFFGILTIAMIFFVGLRTQYNDTDNYEYIYNGISADIGMFENLSWELGENPLFHLTNRLMVKMGFSTQSYLLFYAAITVCANLWFLRKYSCNFPLSVFLFLAVGSFTFNMAAVKQCMAMALALIAVDRALRKHYISFGIWLLLAAGYHPYALMYILVPVMTFRPWSFRTVLMLGFFGIVGMILERLIGTMVDITDLLGENFDAEAFTGEGVNPFRVAVVAVPILVALIARRVIAGNRDREQYLMVNLAMLNAEIMFVGLFGTANYFARLANYFLPFQALAMPWLFTHFEPRSKKLISYTAVICYGLFFVFSNAILDNFDYHYASVPFWEYFTSLF